MWMRCPGRVVSIVVGVTVLACAQDAGTAPYGDDQAQAAVESVTPEVAGEFSIVKTAGYEFSSSMATDGTDYLVSYLSGSSVIVKARTVSAAGTLGAPLSTGRVGDWPLVAFDGTNYLLVWRDITDVSTPNLRGQFVSTGGTKVGAVIRITRTDDVAYLSGLAFGGGQYLVTFEGQDGPMYRKFLSPGGTVGTTHQVSGGLAHAFIFSNLATDGTDFLAVWVGGGNGQSTMARLIRGDGSFAPIITVNASAATTAISPSVAFNGGNYLVVWQDEVRTNQEVVYARLVTSAGVAMGNRRRVAGMLGTHRANGRVVPSGADFAVAYIEGSGNNQAIKLQFVGPLGGVGGTAKTLFVTQNGQVPYLGPMLANGSAFFLVANRLAADYDVRGKFATLVP